MIQQGVFGEVVHVEGSYCHNLDPYWDQYQGDWRMTYNKDHHGDVYPTHGIGPVCQDHQYPPRRQDECARVHGHGRLQRSGIADKRYGKGVVEKYANGDNTMTFIRTEKGKTILVEHNVVTPRPYNRMYQVTGTKGFAN
jgi:hypothetical protein